jgi:hypothetical protein
VAVQVARHLGVSVMDVLDSDEARWNVWVAASRMNV